MADQMPAVVGSFVRRGDTDRTAEAFQFTGNPVELKPWLSGEQFMFAASPDRLSLHVATDEGRTVAHPGDWVVRNEFGFLAIQSDESFRSFWRASANA